MTIPLDSDLMRSFLAVADAGSVTVVVGDLPGPAPKPDDPPAPKPPAPIDGPLRVLIVYESAEAAKMPAGQQSVIYGKTVRDWLNANCAPDGAVKAFRIWDKDADASAEAKQWQDALARPRPAVPYVHVFRGDTAVHEGPLPASPADAVALFDKIKGGK